MNKAIKGWLKNSLRHERDQALMRYRKANHRAALKGCTFQDAYLALAEYHSRCAQYADDALAQVEDAEDLPW
jgi:hypothetical protein